MEYIQYSEKQELKQEYKEYRAKDDYEYELEPGYDSIPKTEYKSILAPLPSGI